MIFVRAIRTSFLVVVLWSLTESHPQCLDYRAPFQSSGQLQFCSQYSAFGCCTTTKDSQIQQTFQNVQAKFPLQTRPRCKHLLKEVLCLACDPYAAHLFEAEGNTKFDIKKATPGLCNDFCLGFYKECPDIINYYVRTSNWTYRDHTTPTPLSGTQSRVLKINETPAENFCHRIRLKDMDYCYPNVKTIESRILGRKYNQGENQGCMCVEKVASSLRNPIAAVHSGDGTHRLFIAEQIGVIHVLLPNGQLLSRPFLDISSKVLSTRSYADERGLLSIAFHPEFKINGRLFVYYSTRLESRSNDSSSDAKDNHKTVLSEFLVSDLNPNLADRDSERVILEIPQPEENHNGGTILFGYDNMLYLTLGDGGAAGDPFGKYGNGLNKETLLGSILRIDIDTDSMKTPYKIPPDNPFIYDHKARPEIYAYGVRNMWRCSIDRGDNKTGEGRGRFFCGDVGQYDYEEIDLIVKGGNYGWRAYEGSSCYDDSQCYSPRLHNAIFPIHAYNHTVGKSILGGYVYRGCQNPNLYGYYVFADTWSSRFFTLIQNRKTRKWDHREICFGDDKYCTDKLTGNFEQFVLSFGEDEAGELYILATSRPSSHQPKGNVYRLVDPERRGDPATCAFTPSSPVSSRKRKPKKCRDTLDNYYYPTPVSNCVYYSSRGFCVLHSIKKYCRKTCGLCDSQ